MNTQHFALIFIAFLAIQVTSSWGKLQFKPLPPRHKVDPAEEKRLISVAEGKAVWMTTNELHEWLKSREHHVGPGFIDITDHPDLKKEDNVHYLNRLQQGSSIEYKIRHSQLVNGTYIPALNSTKIHDTVAHLSSYLTRYINSQTAVDAALWIRDQYQSIADANSRTDISVSLFQHKFEQQSVIARITGAKIPDEVIVIGSHEDSTTIEFSPQASAPGADDDASGVATVLEVFRALVSQGFVPDRTVEFHAYAGEEEGLLGSQDIVASYVKNNINVVSMMQLDMVGYPADKQVLCLISDFVDQDLTNFMEKLGNAYCSLPVVRSKCGYGCSDHASWNSAGFPSAFPFETVFGKDNPYIHTADDTIEKLNFKHALEFAKVAVGFAVELGLN